MTADTNSLSRCRLAVGMAVMGIIFGSLLLPSVASAAPSTTTATSTPSPIFSAAPLPRVGLPNLSYFDLTLAPGQSDSEGLKVTNGSNSPETLEMVPGNGVTSPNSGDTYSALDATAACKNVACWVTGIPTTITVPPVTTIEVPLTIHVPASVGPGQYLGGIIVQPSGPSAPKPVNTNNPKVAAAVTILNQVGVGVAITVGPASGLTPHMAIPGVIGGVVGSHFDAKVTENNTGNTFEKPFGKLSITDSGGKQSFRFVSDTVLPGQGAQIRVYLPGLSPGTYSVSVALDYGHGQVASWSGSITLPKPAVSQTLNHGSETIVYEPGGEPAWIVALISVGSALFLVAVALIIVFLRRRRRALRGRHAAPRGSRITGRHAAASINTIDSEATGAAGSQVDAFRPNESPFLDREVTGPVDDVVGVGDPGD